MKIFKSLFPILLISLVTLSYSSVTLANEKTDKDIFSSKNVEKWEKVSLDAAKKKEVMPDKNVSPYDRDTYDDWSWRSGVICVTDSKSSGIIITGHSRMVAVAPYYYATIESNPSEDVHLDYQSWDKKYPNNNSWQVGVTSTTEYQDHLAAQWAVN